MNYGKIYKDLEEILDLVRKEMFPICDVLMVPMFNFNSTMQPVEMKFLFSDSTNFKVWRTVSFSEIESKTISNKKYAKNLAKELRKLFVYDIPRVKEVKE